MKSPPVSIRPIPQRGHPPADAVLEASVDPTHCAACHYPKKGLDRDTCPECGTAFDASPLSTAERQRRSKMAIRLVVIIVAIQLLVSLLPLLVFVF